MVELQKGSPKIKGSDQNLPTQSKPSFSPIPISYITASSLLAAATTLGPEQIRDMQNSMEQIKSLLQSDAKVSDAKEQLDAKEDKEQSAEKAEKMHAEELAKKEEDKEYAESVRLKEEQEERIAEMIEVSLEGEKVISERLNDNITILEELGIEKFALEVVEHIDEKEAIEAKIEDFEERAKVKAEVLGDLQERIDEAKKDGKGTEGLLNDIEDLSKKDKGVLGKELSELAKNIKEIMDVEKQIRILQRRRQLKRSRTLSASIPTRSTYSKKLRP